MARLRIYSLGEKEKTPFDQSRILIQDHYISLEMGQPISSPFLRAPYELGKGNVPTNEKSSPWLGEMNTSSGYVTKS